jgi:hypothetical protein
VWSLIFGGLWLLGAILYGGYVARKEGDMGGAIAEALIWPIAIVVRLSNQTKEKPEGDN